jgi:uncharacterized Zn-binding protein involved in type VI secretion
MATDIAVVGSTGTGECTCHDETQQITFEIMTGHPLFTVAGIPVAIVGLSIARASCGHEAIILNGSPTFSSGLGGIARVNSQIYSSCITGIILTGNPLFIVGD